MVKVLASNKYLFNQTRDCIDCKFSNMKVDELIYPTKCYHPFASSLHISTHQPSLTPVCKERSHFCGPLGKYYEPKSDK